MFTVPIVVAGSLAVLAAYEAYAFRMLKSKGLSRRWGGGEGE